MAAEVLTREVGLRDGLLPTGRGVKVVPFRGVGSGLWEIRLDGGGIMPAQYGGQYTSRQRAEHELSKYLNEFWDMSDKESSRLKARKEE